MLNQPLGPVDLHQSHTLLLVEKQPCDLPWVRGVKLRVGEHVVQGDIRMYLNDPYGRRLQAAGVLRATFVSSEPAPAPAPLPFIGPPVRPLFDGMLNSGSITVDGRPVNILEGRVQPPGQRRDDEAPVFTSTTKLEAVIPPQDEPPAPVLDVPIAPAMQLELQAEATPAPMDFLVATEPAVVPSIDLPIPTVNEPVATEVVAPLTVTEPLATTELVATNTGIGEELPVTLSIDPSPVVAENPQITHIDGVAQPAPNAAVGAIRRRQISSKT